MLENSGALTLLAFFGFAGIFLGTLAVYENVHDREKRAKWAKVVWAVGIVHMLPGWVSLWIVALL